MQTEKPTPDLNLLTSLVKQQPSLETIQQKLKQMGFDANMRKIHEALKDDGYKVKLQRGELAFYKPSAEENAQKSSAPLRIRRITRCNRSQVTSLMMPQSASRRQPRVMLRCSRRRHLVQPI